MNEQTKRALYIVVPILLITIFFVLFGNNTDNKRENPNEIVEESEPFDSRLRNETTFETTTRDEISELDFEILVEGEGNDEVVAGDVIAVHYRGWLAQDGTIFDQSFGSVNDATGFQFTAGPTGRVIEGWQEGVIGMKIGEVRRLFIPSAQAYGESGSGGVIPPNADLIFDVELIAIN